MPISSVISRLRSAALRTMQRALVVGGYQLLRTLVPSRLKEVVKEQRLRYRILRQYSEDRGAAPAFLGLVRGAVKPERTVLFYPDLPDQWQVVYKLCLLNGYRMTNDPAASYDVVHKHEKATQSPEYEVLKPLRAINASSNDISKARVQRVFAEVFGYALAVDPRAYEGRAVRKSDANYSHDGVIIDCPCEPEVEEGVVYQRLVETENEAGYCVDLRVPYYGGEIPLVYVKYRPRDNRFKTFVSGEVVRPGDVLSEEEMALIRAFAQRMGVDFAEMDVLRDTGDDRLYVVDVNNTPAGPPSKLTPHQQQEAVSLLATAYRRLVNTWPTGPARV